MAESSDHGAPFRFQIKDGSASPDGAAGDVQDAIGNPPLQAFRFKLRTKQGTQSAVIAVAQGALDVSDLAWANSDLEHGTEAVMTARIAHYDGKPVRFVVEHERHGRWEPYAQVQAAVKAGKATGTLRVHHPVLPPTGPTPSSSKLQSAQPANLRFALERGVAEPQPRAEPVPHPKATTEPPPARKVETGALTVKGAIAGERFFLVNARTNKPVKASALKTSATTASGVMFLLGKDRTATFEKLPAGPYKVIFPAEPDASGKKPDQPVVQANAHGAHVVDIKDFVLRGAVCEVEVAPGGSFTLELTLSADGTARVCC